jgi:energy-coupling factor transport system substrate-specific component
MSFSARKLALMGILIALAIALKLPILSIPNVEFLTFVIFSSGFLLGLFEGLLVGVISISIYSTLISPYGLPPLPILAAQILSMGLVGLTGGLASRINKLTIKQIPRSNALLFATVIGFFGLVLTVLYDLLTNLAVAFVMGQFLPVMFAAIPFALVHIASNLVIFAVLSPVLLKLSKRRFQ